MIFLWSLTYLYDLKSVDAFTIFGYVISTFRGGRSEPQSGTYCAIVALGEVAAELIPSTWFLN